MSHVCISETCWMWPPNLHTKWMGNKAHADEVLICWWLTRKKYLGVTIYSRTLVSFKSQMKEVSRHHADISWNSLIYLMWQKYNLYSITKHIRSSSKLGGWGGIMQKHLACLCSGLFHWSSNWYWAFKLSLRRIDNLRSLRSSSGNQMWKAIFSIPT